MAKQRQQQTATPLSCWIIRSSHCTLPWNKEEKSFNRSPSTETFVWTSCFPRCFLYFPHDWAGWKAMGVRESEDISSPWRCLSGRKEAIYTQLVCFKLYNPTPSETWRSNLNVWEIFVSLSLVDTNWITRPRCFSRRDGGGHLIPSAACSTF